MYVEHREMVVRIRKVHPTMLPGHKSAPLWRHRTSMMLTNWLLGKNPNKGTTSAPSNLIFLVESKTSTTDALAADTFDDWIYLHWKINFYWENPERRGRTGTDRHCWPSAFGKKKASAAAVLSKQLSAGLCDSLSSQLSKEFDSSPKLQAPTQRHTHKQASKVRQYCGRPWHGPPLVLFN